MTTPDDILKVFHRFRITAERFCDLIDSSACLPRAEQLLRIYVVLPELIQRAIDLPVVETSDDEPAKKTKQARLTDQEWGLLYEGLKKKLGDWNLYMDVFDPTRDTEAIRGSLADDLADIYRDV
jgi:hypothetical protein